MKAEKLGRIIARTMHNANLTSGKRVTESDLRDIAKNTAADLGINRYKAEMVASYASNYFEGPTSTVAETTK